MANAASGTHNEHTHFCSFGICLRLKFIYISVLERLIAEMGAFRIFHPVSMLEEVDYLSSSVDAGRSGTEKTLFFLHGVVGWILVDNYILCNI